jgi:hypothetical protein
MGFEETLTKYEVRKIVKTRLFRSQQHVQKEDSKMDGIFEVFKQYFYPRRWPA